MSNLEKINDQFSEIFISRLSDKVIERNEIREINEQLFDEFGEINVPFGGLLYLLALEDEKPLLYVYQWNRMADEIRFWILDGNSYSVIDEDDELFSEVQDRWNHLFGEIRKKH